MTEFERRVRERAYKLWEEAGKPDRQDEFWYQAEIEIKNEDAEAGISTPPEPPDPMRPGGGWPTA